MARSKVYLEPTKYEVGRDIPQEKYATALLKIADWFSESRKTHEPAALAKQLFEECLTGVTKDGKKWFSAATASLASRVRMKCRFDIEAMKPLRTTNEAGRVKRAKERERLLRQRAKKGEDPLIPDELRKQLKTEAKYGDNAGVFLSSREAANWEHLREAYVRQFPELATINAEAELKLLCDLHILAERYRMQILSGNKLDGPSRAAAAEELQSLKKALGIHPDQLAKRVKSKADTSIGSAVARVEAMGDYRKLRARFWIEELIEIFQMYHTPSADGLDYQLDEIGLFGLTKCRTCHCAGCGMKNYVGVEITEIEQYLKEKGAIVPVADASTTETPQA